MSEYPEQAQSSSPFARIHHSSHSVTSSPTTAVFPLTPQTIFNPPLENIDPDLLSSVELYGLFPPSSPLIVPLPPTSFSARFGFPLSPYHHPMSSAKGSSHHHSASYTYGVLDSSLASGVSQERSTASPSQPTGLSNQQQQYWGARPPSAAVPSPVPNHLSTSISSPSAYAQTQPQSQPQSANSHQSTFQTNNAGAMQQPPHYSPTQNLPQVQPHYSNSSAPNMMLPPLRMPNDPRTNGPYASSAPPMPAPYGFSSYPGFPSYTVPQSRPLSYSSYDGHVPQHSTSSSVGSEIWTPLSANGSGGYPFPSHQSYGGGQSHGQQPPTPSTIQPSVFPSWQNASDSRGRSTQGTISPLGMLGSDSNRLDRRSSTPGQSGERWDRPSQSGIGLSPNTSDQLSSEEDVKPDVKLAGGVSYTTDAEVKQTPELKRMCFNCSNKSPPSWRKSVLHPGKILCNKCGIFERTHHRPRPPQNDDQKLRKQNQLLVGAYRRELPPALQVMKDDGDSSPQPHSPYSNVPSHATPISATFPVSPHYPSPSESMMTSASLTHRRTGLYQQTSPSQHALATPPISSGLAYTDGDSLTPSRGGYHGHGSSPYAHAYANRRTYSQPMRMTSPIMPFSAGISNTHHASGGSMTPLSQSLGGWNAGRRHSDAQLHSGLLSASSSNGSLSQAQAQAQVQERDNSGNSAGPEPNETGDEYSSAEGGDGNPNVNGGAKLE